MRGRCPSPIPGHPRHNPAVATGPHSGPAGTGKDGAEVETGITGMPCWRWFRLAPGDTRNRDWMDTS
ncbi:hypothetical protein ACTXGQ_05675 [Marinobacter sp. 1Y8]